MSNSSLIADGLSIDKITMQMNKINNADKGSTAERQTEQRQGLSELSGWERERGERRRVWSTVSKCMYCM